MYAQNKSELIGKDPNPDLDPDPDPKDPILFVLLFV